MVDVGRLGLAEQKEGRCWWIGDGRREGGSADGSACHRICTFAVLRMYREAEGRGCRSETGGEHAEQTSHLAGGGERAAKHYARAKEAGKQV